MIEEIVMTLKGKYSITSVFMLMKIKKSKKTKFKKLCDWVQWFCEKVTSQYYINTIEVSDSLEIIV